MEQTQPQTITLSELVERINNLRASEYLYEDEKLSLPETDIIDFRMVSNPNMMNAIVRTVIVFERLSLIREHNAQTAKDFMYLRSEIQKYKPEELEDPFSFPCHICGSTREHRTSAQMLCSRCHPSIWEDTEEENDE